MIYSCSFGKDSLAMLLVAVEDCEKIDEVIFFDTGWEYKSIYAMRDRFMRYHPNVKVTTIKGDFDHYAIDHIVHRKDGTLKKGYGFCGGICRWGTRIKTRKIKAYIKEKYGDNPPKVAVGIAYGEKRPLDERKAYPLIERKITEEECLKICERQGYLWDTDGDPLYKHFRRVSCFCCYNKSRRELMEMKAYYPEYYRRIREMEKETGMRHRGMPDDVA